MIFETFEDSCYPAPPSAGGGRIGSITVPDSVIVSDAEIMRGTHCFRVSPLTNLMDYIEQGYPLSPQPSVCGVHQPQEWRASSAVLWPVKRNQMRETLH